MVLACDDRRIAPVKTRCRRAQPHHTHRLAIGSFLRKSACEIEVNVRAGSRTANVWTERLKGQLRLPEGGAKRVLRKRLCNRYGQSWEVLIVHATAIGKNVEQHNSGKPYAIFRAAL